MISDLRYNRHGHVLYDEMSRKRKALDDAGLRYQRVLSTALEKDTGIDARFALQQEGRAYAEAVAHFSEAVMGWLKYADSHLLLENLPEPN